MSSYLPWPFAYASGIDKWRLPEPSCFCNKNHQEAAVCWLSSPQVSMWPQAAAYPHCSICGWTILHWRCSFNFCTVLWSIPHVLSFPFSLALLFLWCLLVIIVHHIPFAAQLLYSLSTIWRSLVLFTNPEILCPSYCFHNIKYPF